ncbi:hypothetical protein AMELA_G00257420, partial [Ameiurus melas]
FGKTLKSHRSFIDRLTELIRLQEVDSVDKCDFILGFCPIVSRAGTDIEAAVKNLQSISDTKPTVLVVLHHTQQNCVVPNSSRAVHRKNMIAVDCLFHEDQGLLQCGKNNESLSKTSEYIKSLGKGLLIGVKIQEEAGKSYSELRNSFEKTDLQESKRSLHESYRDQQWKPNDPALQKARKRVQEMEKKQWETFQYLQAEWKSVLYEYLDTTEKTLAERDAELEQQKTELAERKLQLQEKNRHLTENTQTLQVKYKIIQEKDKQLNEVKGEYEKTRKS